MKKESGEKICPVCGSRNFNKIFDVKDYFVSGETFPVCACSVCGFKLTFDLPPAGEMGNYYRSEEYISHSDTAKGLVNKAYHAVRNYMLKQKFKVVANASQMKTGKLLDIGAGTGYFAAFMQKQSWTVTATEQSEEARQYAASRWNLSLLPADDLFALPRKSFDVITLWHVMEHLPDLDKHWKTISQLLSDSGTLVVALPNAGSWDAQHYRQFWAAWDVPRHLWHFAPPQIEKLAAKHGFQMIRMKRMPFDAFYISILSEKYKRSKFPELKGIFFGGISWLSSLFNIRRCSSLIYVFRPSV